MAELRIPEESLAGEIRLALAYITACNLERDLLGDDRKAFSEAIANMIAERAGKGISGMRLVDALKRDNRE